jgi:Ca-activated chloride channel family protein
MKWLTLIFLSILLILACLVPLPVATQTRERRVGQVSGDVVKDDVVKVDVDLVVLDALIMQKKTSRVVGGLKQESFILSEDGVKQEITHFNQDAYPLSVLLLVDRGGCLDPFGSEVRRATLEALKRLKPEDEVALMTYHNTAELIEGFSRDRSRIEEALNHIPSHDEEADHCLNIAFYKAAQYMIGAGNPVGRRVIIVITGVTSNFDCDGPSGKAAMNEVFESGSVVCGLIPSSTEQRMESGIMRTATSIGGLFKAPTLRINQLAEETGGEVLNDKPENLDHAFNTLIDHLRSRYSIGFVSSNKKRDGSLRKLKLEISPAAQKSQDGKLVVKTRRSYIAPKS